MSNTKEQILIKIEELEKELNNCDSDFGYWSIQRDLKYWREELKTV